MGSEIFKKFVVQDIASSQKNAIVGGPFGSNLVSRDYVDSGVPVIRGGNMGEGRWIGGEFAFVTPEKAESLSGNLAHPGDVVFTQRGTLGQVSIVPKGQHEKYLISQSQMKLTADQLIADPLYLYYEFISPQQQEYIRLNSIQTGVPHTNLGILKSTPLILPSLNYQKAIAHILGSLDDKIELNRQMNETLEAMAQALFKSWFVNFDPVIDNALAADNPIPEALQAKAAARQALGDKRKPLPEAIQQQFPSAFEYNDELGWIPQGWRIQKLNSLLDIRYGKDHKKLDDGQIPVYGSGGIMRFAERHLYEGEAILIPRKGSLNNLVYLNTKFWCVDTIFYGVPQASNVGHYLYLTLKQYDFVAMNVGSAVPSMTTKVLNDLDFLVPNAFILSSFNELLEEFRQAQSSFHLNSESLARLRDTLLPKLLSGELRIPDAEKLVAEAL